MVATTTDEQTLKLLEAAIANAASLATNGPAQNFDFRQIFGGGGRNGGGNNRGNNNGGGNGQ
jgi:hypothetical protein